MLLRLRLILLLGLMLLGGCVHIPEKPATENKPAPPRVNKCGGDCVELKARHGNDDAALLRKVDELLSARRLASLDAVLGRHLDVAVEILRRRDSKRPATEADLAVARTVDARLGHPADDGWTARLQGRGRGGLERAEEILAQVQGYERKQEWRSARDLVQRNRTALAPYPYHAVHAGLTLSEAHRRLGQTDLAAKTWQETVLAASALVGRWPAPALWEPLAGQRPVSTPWPAQIGSVLAARLPRPLPDLLRDPKFAVEALVWLHIGNARLERSEPELALTAFKHADSHDAFPLWDDFLTLHEAKALLAMQQTPAATSLLTVLAGRPSDCPWRLPALALLGAGKLQEGHTQQALAFLRQAVAESSPADFLWRADAEANLGLAFLAEGDQPNGLQWLHDSQNRFESTQNSGGLLQCLGNEAMYFVQIGRTDDANRLRQRMQELEGASPSLTQPANYRVR